MKKLLPFSLLLMVAMLASAQVHNRCGSFDLVKLKNQQQPGYLDRINTCFQNAKQLAQANKNSRAANDTIYHIQVVFHVVYTTAEENIPDSVIFSQIEVLNEDYRRLNADTVFTRDTFMNVAADAGIEFYLAITDPDGNPTTGITRTQGNPGFLGFNPFTDNVKEAAGGGVDPWPTDRYLNIWVCNIFNGLGVLGYAFPPDNAPNWPSGSTTDSSKQGVVLHYPAVGRNFANPIDVTVAKGRSATHEIGHYLGLRHIWGDGACGEDDGIADTPDAADAHQQTCDTTMNSCPDSITDYPDMIENYMDYSDDRCLNMFTKDQVGIMRAMLQTSRAGIATVSTTTPTAIKETAEAFRQVVLAPNPSRGLAALYVQTANKGGYTYSVYNAIGDKITADTNMQAWQSQSVIDLSDRPAGIYLIKLTAGGQTVIKKMVVSK